jgi:hypothetical protein
VVLHGVTDAGMVEASADGVTWEPLAFAPAIGASDAAIATAVPRAHLTASYVRTSGVSAGALRELSVWERTPGEDLDPPGAAATVAEPSAAVPAGGGTEDAGPDRAVPAAVAALLLAALVVGLDRVRRRPES